MDKNQRPRTKRLERPTPNLTHPVISTKRLNDNELQLGQCIHSLNKCQISCSTQTNNKLKVNMKSMSSMSSLSSSLESNRQINGKQKVSDLKRNCEPIPSDTQESIESKNVQKISDSLNEDKYIDKNTDKNLLNREKEESDWSGWQQFNAQLIPCPHCCRTFFPHRLPVHEKCCKGLTKVSHRSKPILRTTPIKCASLECTTCGRKYRTSLTSHPHKCKTFSNYHKKKVNTEKIESQIKSISEYRLKTRLKDEKSIVSDHKSLSDRLREFRIKSKESTLKKD